MTKNIDRFEIFIVSNQKRDDDVGRDSEFRFSQNRNKQSMILIN